MNNQHPDKPSFESLSSLPRIKGQLKRRATKEISDAEKSLEKPNKV